MKQSWERYRAICYGAAALGIAVCIGCFLAVSDTKNALGVVGDWVWERTGFGLALMPAAVVTILFLAALRFALLADRKQIRCIAAAAVILCAGFCSDLVILHYGGRAGLAESAMAPLSTFSTGYLDPVLTAGSPADYTTHFQQKILLVPDKEIPRHIHVHPPANLLISALALYLPGIGNGIFPETAAELEMLRRETILLPPGNTPEAIAASLNLILGMVLALLAGKGMLMAALLSCRPKTPGLALMLIAFGSGAAGCKDIAAGFHGDGGRMRCHSGDRCVFFAGIRCCDRCSGGGVSRIRRETVFPAGGIGNGGIADLWRDGAVRHGIAGDRFEMLG